MLFAASTDSSDVSSSNWTGLVDLEEETALHNIDACKGDFQCTDVGF